MHGSSCVSLVILVVGELGNMPAEKFSRYVMREELGFGGMATVYRARSEERRVGKECRL